LELGKFDTSQGSLHSAALTINAEYAGSSGVFNSSAALNLTNVQVSLFGSLIGSVEPSGPTALPASINVLSSNSFVGSRTFVIRGPGAQTSTGPFTLTFAPEVLSFSGADLQGFVGAGNFGLSFTTNASASVPAQFFSVALTPSAKSSVSLSLSYDYTPASRPVPTPGAEMLLLSGMGALGFVMPSRRRKLSYGAAGHMHLQQGNGSEA